MAGFNIERLVGNLLIIFGGAVFIGIIVVLLFSVAKGADLTSLMGGDLFNKNYMRDFNKEQTGNQVKISWKITHQDELQARRIYVVTDPAIISPDELRSTQYATTPRKDGLPIDFKGNIAVNGADSTESITRTLPAGVSRIEIVAANKEGKIVQKKEFIYLLYDQNMLDRFSQKLTHAACSNKNDCNVILCKKTDLTYKSLPSNKYPVQLTEKELTDLIKALHSNCKTKSTSLSGTGFGPSIIEPVDCSTTEIYSLFEDALTLKAQQKEARGEGTFDDLRQKLYDASYAKTCIDAVSTVLDERGWKAI